MNNESISSLVRIPARGPRLLPLLLCAGCTVSGAPSPTFDPAASTDVETSCNDGLDDDADGHVDCDDFDCASSRFCQAAPVPENTAARCQNGVDDDRDGHLDCDDWSCDAFCEPAAVPENTAARCQNGLDDDHDGYADCDDWDCAAQSACASESPDACVEAAKSACNAGSCAAPYGALQSCIASCGVFASPECVSQYCGGATATYVDCMMRACPALTACGGACASACTNLAPCNGITAEACQQSCATVTPADVPTLACGTVIDCSFLPVCSSLANGCAGDEWSCGDGQCVPLASACDGDALCSDQSDETVACEAQGCANGARLCGGTCASCPAHASATACASGACVATACEVGFDVCADGCCPFTGGCYSTEFTCDSGACIAAGKQCDGIPDCADRSDEDQRCPKVATLYDPARPSIPYECAGTTLTMAELAALFDPGTDKLLIDPHVAVRSRRCNALTGCTDWTASSYVESYAFELRYEPADDISFVRARGYPTSEGYAVVTEPDFVVYGLIAWDIDETDPVRVRFAHDAGGQSCVQMTFPHESYEYDGVTYESYGAGSVLQRPALAGTALDELPPDPGTAYHCSDAPPSAASIAAAWFQPGSLWASLESRPRASTGVYRRCYARTGCSAWTTTSTWASLSSLEISGGNISVRVLEGSYSWSVLSVTNGTFAGPLQYPGGVSGHVGTSCIEADYSSRGSFDSGPDSDRYAWEVVQR